MSRIYPPECKQHEGKIKEDTTSAWSSLFSLSSSVIGKRRAWFYLYKDGRYRVLDIERGLKIIREKKDVSYTIFNNSVDEKSNSRSFRSKETGKPELLLHVCCGGCLAGVLNELSKYFRIRLLFFNPNIHPPDEHDIRLEGVNKVASFFSNTHLKPLTQTSEKNCSRKDDENNDENDYKKNEKDNNPVIEIDNIEIDLKEMEMTRNIWEDFVVNNISSSERLYNKEDGPRCQRCYYYRLFITMGAALFLNIPFVATTLTISPHKSATLINNIGNYLAEYVFKGYDTPVYYLNSNFKKAGGFQEAVETSRKIELYRQNYCGCRFSIEKDY
ncbi:MAG: epoxyqueuosine reductase QueH [Thermoplasmata archaeon]